MVPRPRIVGAARAARPRPRAARDRDDEGARARAEDRRAAEGRAGRHRAGGQGAARHEGRAPDLPRHAAGPLPGVHADGRSHRHLAQDRQPRRALAPARHRQGVPRAAQLQRRRDHPHRRVGPIEGRHPRRPELLLQDLGRHAAARRAAPLAGHRLPGAEPGREAAARSADRRLHARSASTTRSSTSARWSSSAASCRTSATA